MTGNDTRPFERLAGDESRRSFLKKSAIATVGLSAAASGVASAQDGPGDGAIGEGPWKALIFQNNLYPEARFTFVSGVVEWNPSYGGIDDSWFTDYNTRMIRWLNTGEHVQLFVADDAEVGQYDENLGFVVDDEEREQPQVYEVSPEWSLFEDDPKLATINFGPAEEETEDQLLEADGWWADEQDAVVTDRGEGNATSGGNTTTSG
ncbi:twin-arginine translocation signal domain-containing protein [Haloterrigena sp. SYSU A558-1]|uniref:Twin-arginine translocation signal domain-containing protein n=1 Tax=Haloterrigena gelatinilytica TaxID=2741724 RepID=A0A8J8GHD6_9EURY|nr:twin-arginine translocation signal domain-containing protein [Haloterrigena gelatinilytica]NUB89431.1 twin-arginine translocation signal domain-containing protein [Haloterrigena gelatinilytica]NUC70722.1 twin-arginine translocation signal domain-containing protein [Haloterrigena gelatinilytica]